MRGLDGNNIQDFFLKCDKTSKISLKKITNHNHQ